ncbi:unnamed protein product [Schistosoma margrebowiei]|uniref:Uncharacterized protein n=1 Tax=Schistosoma margrebowiei TaxID=48269 RepID=A0A183LE23_9TREM|nr:unnamed protein product [Schistosoma margrebowiei]
MIRQMKVKTTTATAASVAVDPKIHKGKSKILKYNTKNTNSITLGEESMEEVGSFIYLDSSINEHRRSDADLKAEIDIVRAEFLHSKNI